MNTLKYIAEKVFSSGICRTTLAFLAFFLYTEKSFSQQRIAHVQPDALGPGMTIAMEVLAPAKDSGAFGTDGIYLPSSKILLLNPADSFRCIFGPVVVSWNGRVLQVPVMAPISAIPGIVQFQILTGNKKSDFAAFEISQPHSKLSIFGGATLGDASFALFSFGGKGNTIVADEIEFFGNDFQNKGFFDFSTVDSFSLSGNTHYHPVTLLSRGPIHLRFAELSVSGDSLNGGPGGGGGGAGFAGTGGAGYTGGGSDSDYTPLNLGSGANSTISNGGASSTGVLGGASSFISPNIDQGGGGGTGCPYGSSGITTGGDGNSPNGGFGGGSAGGETSGIAFGGGGGAFATDGLQGAGTGNNGGKHYGGRFLLPMQGGSGGGGGNHTEGDSTAGSGGGGGGALTLISFDTLSLTNSIVSADGVNGTSGINQADAGGGGGAGGGILLSGRLGIAVASSIISVNPGSGGLGGAGVSQTSKGGGGSIGRIRLDGEIDEIDSNLSLTGVQMFGPTLNVPQARLIGPFALFTGLAGDSASLTDSIRIYYRNQHSSWSFFDTVRFKSNGKFHWQAFLPTGHDSSLFITAMAEVRSPSQSFANFEPQRLLSHLSSGIIKVKASPDLVLDQDTLIFGCYKIGDTCVSANLYFSNLGEDSLHIRSITIPNSNFTVSSKTSVNVGYYERDSIVITYCPTKVGKDTTLITIISSNDTTRAVLIGCGIDKDTRITLTPMKLDFGKLKVGKCDTLSFIAHSIGKDTALFSPAAFSHPPFTIIKPQNAVSLAPKDSLRVLVSFCPDDTGAFHTSFIVTEKRDSVEVTGIGTKTSKILLVDTSIQGQRLCVGECTTLKAHFRTLGNDTVLIASIVGHARFEPDVPVRIPPQTDTLLTVHYCAEQKGAAIIVLGYISDSDSPVDSSVLHYFGVQPEFVFDSVLHFSSLCLPSKDSLPFSLREVGADTVKINSIHLLNGSEFILSGDTSGKTDSSHFFVNFIPSSSGTFDDTLSILLNLGVCGDSLLKIPVSGSSATSTLQFSQSILSFGPVDTGSCKMDSVNVTASCPVTIQMPTVSAPFSIIFPASNSLSFKAGETKSIVYQYCPTTISNDSTVQSFSGLPNGSFDLKLNGNGTPAVDSPFVRFKLENVIATTGSQFQYLISVDSISSGTNITSLHAILHYDPTLVQPLGLTGILWKISGNREITPGVYQFTASNSAPLTAGPFAMMEFLALYGPHDTSTVFLDNIQVANNALTLANSGFIRVVHCGNLSGNIIVAGDYLLGNPTPNPSNGNLSFPVILGNDGVLHIKMYSPSGMMALEKSFDLKHGENTIVLDVSSLTSGIYYLSAESWGWRDGKTLIIEK